MLDLSNVKNDNEAIPTGSYVVSLNEATIKSTRDNTGEYINAKFRVMQGEHEGRFIYQMFNIKNKNPQAVEIGLKQLKSFMQASGFSDFVLKSVTDLEGATAIAVVKNKTDDYGEKAVISYFKPLEKVSAAAQATGTDKHIPF